MSTTTHLCHTILVLTCASLSWASVVPAAHSQLTPSVSKSVARADSCPSAEQISPCTCSLNSVSPALPELSCINHEGEGPVDLSPVFQKVNDHIAQTGGSKEWASLLLVNNRLTSLTATYFAGLQYRNLSLYDTNFTTVESTAFSNMENTLTYLYIKGDRLTTSVFTALRPLKNLQALTLELNLRSFKTIPANALADSLQLRQVTLNGVANLISSGAFVNLPLLERIKITNQVEKIESGAFQLDNSTANPVTVLIDLSENKLNEDSFDEGFVQFAFPASTITFDLSSNPLTYLPEKIFKPFLEANTANRVVMRNSKLVCGKCDSHWAVSGSIKESQLEVSCSTNNQLSIWKYDWSRVDCPKSGSRALLGIAGPVLLVGAAVMHLLLALAHS